MNESSKFIIRTEDIKSESIPDLFVGTDRDNLLIDALKASSPLIIEGSRGTGKSFLFRVCEYQQFAEFPAKRILPVYVSFAKSSLVHAGNNEQFQHWMLSRICSRIIRVLQSKGLTPISSTALRVLTGEQKSTPASRTRLEKIAKAYESSFRKPGLVVDDEEVPEVEDFKDAVEDICEELDISRINLLFDEAAHIFRPEQQRQFFTLFRDMRSPYITCNAAVYPGVTVYGSTFEVAHDARVESLHREVTDRGYQRQMRQIIIKQADSNTQREIEKNGANFDALAFAVSGNPRLLLRTVELAPSLRSNLVQTTIKDFYRNTIWAEHSGLAERYAGHRRLIDWGRTFIEEVAIPDALAKNKLWKDEKKSERTCFFWIHREAPEAVKEALRLLTYTGIVNKLDSGIVATRREVGTRYAINIGCLAATEANPVAYITDVRAGLSVKRFTEYGANYKPFTELANELGPIIEADLSGIITAQLSESIDVLDLTDYQKESLHKIKINTIGETLSSSESDFQRAYYIGPVRSRQIMNVATAAVLEYLSG